MLRKFFLLFATIFCHLIASPTIAAPASMLQKVLVPDMLGADLAYFESVTGPARNTFGNQKVYKMGRCDVTVGVDEGKIRWFEVEIKPACEFNVYAFIFNFRGNPIPINQLTFEKFEAITGDHGEFSATCLMSCGNAADPIVYQHWSGSRADANIEVSIGVALSSDTALAAAGKWEQAMLKNNSEDWVIDGKFNCSDAARRYQPIARAAFKHVKASSISVGYQIPMPRCASE